MSEPALFFECRKAAERAFVAHLVDQVLPRPAQREAVAAVFRKKFFPKTTGVTQEHARELFIGAAFNLIFNSDSVEAAWNAYAAHYLASPAVLDEILTAIARKFDLAPFDDWQGRRAAVLTAAVIDYRQMSRMVGVNKAGEVIAKKYEGLPLGIKQHVFQCSATTIYHAAKKRPDKHGPHVLFKRISGRTGAPGESAP